jgi:E3 ubiquitin-protein ligase EDD1
MDHTTHVIAHQLPINDENYELKFKEVADQITKIGYTQANIFSQLPNVCEAVVSHTHIAFLLEDGRVCRLNYSLENENKEANLSNETTTTNTTTTTAAPTTTTSTTTATQNNKTTNKIKIQNTGSLSNTSNINNNNNNNSSNQNTSTSTAGAVAAAVALASSTLNNTNTNTSSSTQSQFRPQSRSGFRSHETFIIPAASEILAPISTHSFGRG